MKKLLMGLLAIMSYSAFSAEFYISGNSAERIFESLAKESDVIESQYSNSDNNKYSVTGVQVECTKEPRLLCLNAVCSQTKVESYNTYCRLDMSNNGVFNNLD